MKTCFLIFVFSVFFGSAFAVTCQSGWIQNGDNCYQFNVVENVTWTGAMAFCDKERANLVDIDSDVEFNFLDSVLEGFGQLNGNKVKVCICKMVQTFQRIRPSNFITILHSSLLGICK